MHSNVRYLSNLLTAHGRCMQGRQSYFLHLPGVQIQSCGSVLRAVTAFGLVCQIILPLLFLEAQCHSQGLANFKNLPSNLGQFLENRAQRNSFLSSRARTQTQVCLIPEPKIIFSYTSSTNSDGSCAGETMLVSVRKGRKRDMVSVHKALQCSCRNRQLVIKQHVVPCGMSEQHRKGSSYFLCLCVWWGVGYRQRT